MNSPKIYKRSDDFVYRRIGHETLLVPIQKAIQKLHSIYTLNEIACRIWGLLDGKKDLREIVAILLSEYQIDNQTLLEDTLSYLEQLESIEAVSVK